MSTEKKSKPLYLPVLTLNNPVSKLKQRGAIEG